MDQAWQLEARPTGAGELEISLGGRWCMEETLPAPDLVTAKLDGSVRQVRFDATQLKDWDTGLLSFLGSILKTCAERGIAADTAGLPPGTQRLLAMALAVPEQTVPGRDSGPVGIFAQVGSATLEFFRGIPAMLAFLGEITQSLGRLATGRARCPSSR